jgi:DNA-binding MarR family transcriptional regulator
MVSDETPKTDPDGQHRTLSFSTEEVGAFFGALAAARDRFGYVTKAIAREHALGPRGPWILGLLGRKTVSPHELARMFNIGRSLVTAELSQLQEAGLIFYAKSTDDGRRVELSLTPLGREVRDRLSRDLAALLETRLAHYGKTQILETAALLRDFAEGATF